MLFNTTGFAVFFVVVWTAWTLLRRWPRPRLVWLLAASFFFYACWDARYLLLLLGVTFVDWGLGAWLARVDDVVVRRRIVALAVAVNLGVLGLWKYTDLVLSTVHAAAAWSASASPSSLTSGLTSWLTSWTAQLPTALVWVLPVGISFYTFQGLGYVVDVYRRKHAAFASPWKFALAKAFFPQLVAGPIVRPGDIVPQFDAPKELDDERLGRGLVLVLGGLLKKAVADALAAGIVDRVFDLPEQYSTLETLAAIYGYAFQIYGDFAGYTDVAIGIALLLGFDLPKNFDHPYRATSLRDFWRRWHISLSSWLRDYLYVALGGNRGGFLRTQRNLFVTMVLGGLWHGASWTFVWWGALHGAGLVVERVADRVRTRFTGRPTRGDEPVDAARTASSSSSASSSASSSSSSSASSSASSWPARVLGWFVTFHVVVALWVFFRADSVTGALAVFGQLGRGLGGGASNVSTTTAVLLGVAFVAHFVPGHLRRVAERAFTALPAFGQALVVVVVLALLQLVSTGAAQPFIYFQF
jgi:D-alanyl-lipoteichoic acid acyltransferase DltB (MBOAT superfamily)